MADSTVLEIVSEQEEVSVETLETEAPEEEIELILEDLIFEEITIDGICGVY
jgi:mycofactocin precursor